jgi:hypothetical protein
MVRRFRHSSYDAQEAAAARLSDRTIGLLWLAGGAAVTLITYAMAAPGGVYVVAWGAMLVGVVKIVGALGDAQDSDGAPLSYRDRIVLGQEMAFRAMLYIAKETGDVSGASAATIEKVLWRIMDKEFPADQREALLFESEAEGDGFLETLRTERSNMAPSFPVIILGAAAQVALADGAIQPNVEAKLIALAQALSLDEADLKAAVAAAQRA